MTRADVHTGRLSRGLVDRAARIVFGDTVDAAIDTELGPITVVDEAHLVMLAERGLVATDRAAELLIEIRSLRANGFAPLRGTPAPRGVYLRYEGHLIDRLGVHVGGVLHTGRSRNDLKATVHHLRLRASVVDALRALLRLQAVLLSVARRHRATVMPAYSQFQPATPISYGYYLCGVAESLSRDIHGLLVACDGLLECPLGAAAGTGTDVAIDPARTADLLGFATPVAHAAYAVASRDTAARVLSAAALAGVTLSRLSIDLQLWSTQEFDLVWFPDSLVGSSSVMPQKRNPFLLEHIRGGAGALVGAFTTAVTTMKCVPFGNSVEVGTEAVAPVLPGVDRLTDIVELAISTVAGARPNPRAMSRGAERGFTVATALANRLVAQDVPFRVAHGVVGALVTELIAEGVAAPSEVPPDILAARLTTSLAAAGVPVEVRLTAEDLDPAVAAAAADFGGGPGPRSFAAAHGRLARTWRDHVSQVAAWVDRLRAADDARDKAVCALVRGRST